MLQLNANRVPLLVFPFPDCWARQGNMSLMGLSSFKKNLVTIWKFSEIWSSNFDLLSCKWIDRSGTRELVCVVVFFEFDHQFCLLERRPWRQSTIFIWCLIFHECVVFITQQCRLSGLMGSISSLMQTLMMFFICACSEVKCNPNDVVLQLFD